MSGIVHRAGLIAAVRASVRRSPVTLLLGPRQCGKTTIAQALGVPRSQYFDLEDPEVALRANVAKQVLAPLRGLVVIDEIQREPLLFELLRVLADRRPLRARFLVLGSASPLLVRGASESLAGRVALLEMSGFDVAEIEPRRHAALWLRGGYPRSFLARTESDSFAWRGDFATTFVERDIPQLGIRVPAHALRRFWMMLAHYHGQLLNAAELARAMGTGENPVRHYLDILVGAFMVRQLRPWFENVGKRLVKAPRIYVRDTGLLHYLLGIRNRTGLFAHPKLGASWEGFVVEQIVSLLRAERDAWFYRTHAGAELDLLVVRDGRRYGFELKHADTPAVTKSMRTALSDLRLEQLWVVHPGERTFALDARIQALALRDLAEVVRDRKLDRR